MTGLAKRLAGRPDVDQHFIRCAADPAVSGDLLLTELRAASVAATRSSVYAWRQKYRAAKRHRPNCLAGRVASALRSATAEQLAAVRLPAGNPTAAVFRLGRKRLYAVARQLNLYPPATESRNCGASGLNDA